MTEAELIKGCIRQDRACQRTLYERFYGKMMAACLRYAKNRDEAKDMLQDGFLKMFKNLPSYSGNGSFEGWVRRIMVNNAIDQLRKNKQENLIVSTYDPRHEAEQEEEVEEDELLSRISTDDILKAVQQLTPAYRTVFNLYVIDEYTHKEIAEMLNISEGTSKSNLAKARHNLRKYLGHLLKEKA